MFRGRFRGGSLVGIFILGTVLFSYPVLTMFNVNALVIGIPLLYFYIFAAWFLVIVLVYSVAKKYTNSKSSQIISPDHPRTLND